MQWEPSSVYRFDGFYSGMQVMHSEGVAGKTLYMGGDCAHCHMYGLINVAAFLAQAMKETIRYVSVRLITVISLHVATQHYWNRCNLCNYSSLLHNTGCLRWKLLGSSRRSKNVSNLEFLWSARSELSGEERWLHVHVWNRLISFLCTFKSLTVLFVSSMCNIVRHSKDYHCSEEEKHMECEVDPDMTITAVTNAKWWASKRNNLYSVITNRTIHVDIIVWYTGGVPQDPWCAVPNLSSPKRDIGISTTHATIHGQLRPNLVTPMRVNRVERLSMM